MIVVRTGSSLSCSSTFRPDVDPIEANAKGMMEPSCLCVGVSLSRVERSIELYGLNLPDLSQPASA